MTDTKCTSNEEGKGGWVQGTQLWRCREGSARKLRLQQLQRDEADEPQHEEAEKKADGQSSRENTSTGVMFASRRLMKMSVWL